MLCWIIKLAQAAIPDVELTTKTIIYFYSFLANIFLYTADFPKSIPAFHICLQIPMNLYWEVNKQLRPL